MTKKNDETFETAINKLENTVEKLEKQDITLEEAISLYEQGVKLSQFCSNKLNEVKKRIDVLVEKDGIKERVPFDKDINID